MQISYNEIRKIYGEDTVNLLNDEANLEVFAQNISYLKNIGITNINEVAERYFFLFTIEPAKFKKKINALIEVLGTEYASILEENIDLWEELL